MSSKSTTFATTVGRFIRLTREDSRRLRSVQLQLLTYRVDKANSDAKVTVTLGDTIHELLDLWDNPNRDGMK